MTRAWISAGSNVDPELNIRRAIEQLRARFGELVLSPLYQTRAEGFEGDDFLNLVVGVDTELPPEEVRGQLCRIEDRQGRVRQQNKFAPRTLDLDLLTWGDLVDSAQNLPRDEILRYAFVLKPLADVAPLERHPLTGQTYQQHWERFSGDREGLKKI